MTHGKKLSGVEDRPDKFVLKNCQLTVTAPTGSLSLEAHAEWAAAGRAKEQQVVESGVVPSRSVWINAIRRERKRFHRAPVRPSVGFVLGEVHGHRPAGGENRFLHR